MLFWQKQMVYLTEKALEKAVTDEEKREKQLEAMKNYILRYKEQPEEIHEFLIALDRKLINMERKTIKRHVKDEELYRWGYAWGYKWAKTNLNYYTKDEEIAFQNVFAYWHGKVEDEQIYLKNVMQFGEP